ncbi:MAG: cbb3-type cytochrome oxidase assembly protein CcoS [Advenella sp.]|uniref:Cbb3-type cytochrome oxidase assembly protein CcoS n=1 Tax=Advenella kashmirensis TaxID=310575 RepID=A0A356LIQ7_9BURK|nr:cbb3-type cytochrome oxidase assembly protein CcoS [Advenella kashmirensis]
MDVFFLLVFLAFLFVMSIGGVLYWAVMSGQFEDSDENASVILQDEDAAIALPDSEWGREATHVPSAKSSLPMR